jgi:hypothetical protein
VGPREQDELLIRASHHHRRMVCPRTSGVPSAR